MKEDSQLICPIGYDISTTTSSSPTTSLWSLIENELTDKLPLKDVTLRNVISSTTVNITSLPLRFMPSNANLFKGIDIVIFIISMINIIIVIN